MAGEPDGLLWVHCAEIDAYADIAYRSGLLTASETDRYVFEPDAEFVDSPMR